VLTYSLFPREKKGVGKKRGRLAISLAWVRKKEKKQSGKKRKKKNTFESTDKARKGRDLLAFAVEIKKKRNQTFREKKTR